ncbi:MAG: DNA-3-methyladenine glycosylase I [Candidatus Limivicinus sp.]|jgi:DNA-3-methyladenine glycosylase I
MENTDERRRCSWVNLKNPLCVQYHDMEWGRPLHDDRALFEFLILESFQAGLSWECILNKREAFRKAFDNFNPESLCRWGDEKTEELMKNPAIVRNRRKISAALGNARVFQKIQREFGSFDSYLWGWIGGRTIIERGRSKSELSDRISADLKKRGMKFTGSTVTYSFLQAAGLIYSHDEDCFLSRGEQP